MRLRVLFYLTALGLLLFPLAVRADEDAWLVVPGKSVGKIAIGMDQREVFKLLGTPQMQNDFETIDRKAQYLGDRPGAPDPEGVTQSDWTTTIPLPTDLPKNNALLCYAVTVYVRETKVIQIEVNVARFHTVDGLSSQSTGVEWRKRFPKIEEFYCKYRHTSAGGIPATKHFVGFQDAVQEGVGWSFDTFGNLAPDPDPDGGVATVIVHAPGEKLLPDPDGGSRFYWKDRPERKHGENGD